MILTQIQTQLVPVAMLVQRSLRSFDSASRVYNSHVENAPTGLAQGNVAAHAYDHTASRILVILENDETTWFTFCPLFLRRQFEHRPYHSQLADCFAFSAVILNFLPLIILLYFARWSATHFPRPSKLAWSKSLGTLQCPKFALNFVNSSNRASHVRGLYFLANWNSTSFKLWIRSAVNTDESPAVNLLYSARTLFTHCLNSVFGCTGGIV